MRVQKQCWFMKKLWTVVESPMNISLSRASLRGNWFSAPTGFATTLATKSLAAVIKAPIKIGPSLEPFSRIHLRQCPGCHRRRIRLSLDIDRIAEDFRLEGHLEQRAWWQIVYAYHFLLSSNEAQDACEDLSERLRSGLRRLVGHSSYRSIRSANYRP